MHLSYHKALIIGGSSGSGKEIALHLAAQAIDTTVVARGIDKLKSLSRTEPRIHCIQQDASAEGVAVKLLSEIKPNLLILCAGHGQVMSPFFKQSWEEFSGTWNADTKIAHSFMSAAINLPMQAGSTIISFSSGAGLSGSRLSGGYAGAKRMQHFLTEYAEQEAKNLQLDLNFYSIIPKQLIATTTLGKAAGSAYAAAAGKDYEQFMSQWKQPLTPVKISECVMELLAQDAPSQRSYAITGEGMAALS